MAEIKSALEIALERAAALGAGEDDSKRQAQEKGQALARQCLEGYLTPADMATQLAGLPPESSLSAAQALVEGLFEGRERALPGLKAMCSGAAEEAYEAIGPGPGPTGAGAFGGRGRAGPGDGSGSGRQGHRR